VALAEAAGINAASIQQLAGGWLQDLQAELESRASAALAIQPTEIAEDRRSAIVSAYDYVETVRSALTDSKISQQELADIAQVAANAAASLLAQGGPQLQNLAGSLDDITAKIARGQLPDVQGLLAVLESSLPPRPSLP
jgi:ABC-type transporter Mla subunit MlaD